MKSPTTLTNPIGYYRLCIFLPVLAIVIGGIIYIVFRPSEHVFFNWIRVAGLDNWLDVVRSSSFFPGLHVPEWIVYSLPNGLWAFAYALLITGIWSGRQSWLKYFWMASIPVLVLGYEMLQFMEFIPGTFCIQDIALGAAGLIFGIFIGVKIIKLKKHEKPLK